LIEPLALLKEILAPPFQMILVRMKDESKAGIRD
jgi:hypothetical protein